MKTEIDILLGQTEEKIEALKDDLRLEERLRERLLAIRNQRVVSASIAPAVSNNGENNHRSSGGHRSTGTIVDGSLMSHIVAVLEEAGHRLKAREIADRVTSRGYTTSANGGVPVAVSTTLAHDHGKLFQKVGYGIYDLKSRHKPESQQGGSD